MFDKSILSLKSFFSYHVDIKNSSSTHGVCNRMITEVQLRFQIQLSKSNSVGFIISSITWQLSQRLSQFISLRKLFHSVISLI